MKMNPAERRNLMQKADGFEELLSFACKGESGHGSKLSDWVDAVESFLENNGFNRAKPWKMAVTYVLIRHGHTATSVAKWWGHTDSNYWSLSEKTAKKYLREMKELINEHPDANTESHWTSGDKVYEPNEDPLAEYFDVRVTSEETKLSAFC